MCGKSAFSAWEKYFFFRAWEGSLEIRLVDKQPSFFFLSHGEWLPTSWVEACEVRHMCPMHPWPNPYHVGATGLFLLLGNQSDLVVIVL